MKYPISYPNTASVIPKFVAFMQSINFSSNVLLTTKLVIIAPINAIDLLGILGISFFSVSKNGFNPFFILLFVIRISTYNTIKFNINVIK